ncbi:hypothetical protein OIU83_11250 [Flavobacterium sp. LS1R49]|uniref:Uncharacterized protein n=1 Tax=Flavobacterium shii TaxID=2987687 RepID=A0A9X2ZCV5_9FLAO|nr:hypothetical protein [Flavobacterium shii]MCV9928235.1 hypothetical protein [Flavobacterium shii]
MNSLYKNFYRQFYLKTGGFIPTKPLNQNIFPGDYFQIKNGEIILLGNLYRDNLISPQEVDLSLIMPLNPSNWNISDGISKPYSGRGQGHGAIEGQFEFSKQILAFANKGSFIFRTKEPKSLKINNWNKIQQQLIIKLTQTLFSFRELYVVTESATAASTTLAIASNTNAELELASDVEIFGLVDIFGHHTTKTIQSKDIDYYHREDKRKPAFFKAKKLVVQEEKFNDFITDFVNKADNSSEWVDVFFDSNFHNHIDYTPQVIIQNTQEHILDMLKSDELNPSTALLYFKWAEANLDDIEKLFASYRN